MGGKPDLSLEKTYTGIVAGVDEAGRGPWAGPVVAAAVVLDVKRIPKGIDDSKKVSATKRETLYDQLINTHEYSVGVATVSEIDTLNILEATKLAMCRAVENLPRLPDVALVDGNQPPKLPCRVVHTVVDGDALCLSIAAASIIAKVTRDRLMRELSTEFPGYGWERNAGYGTSSHQAAIMQLGITPYHRRSWAPIRELIEATDLFAAIA